MSKYNWRIIIITIAAIIFLLFFFRNRKFTVQDNVVARINDSEITKIDFNAYVARSGDNLSDNEKRLALDYMVSQRVILLYAEKSGIIESQLKSQFEKEIDYARKNLLIEHLFDSYIRRKMKITSKEKKKYFATHNFYTLHQITISRMELNAYMKIGLAKRKLDAGEDFFKVMRKFSDKSLIQNDGFFAYVNPETLAEPYYSHVKELMEPGKYTDIFETNYGYTILYRGENPTYKEAKLLVDLEIADYVKSKLYKELKHSLEKKINIDEKLLKDLYSLELWQYQVDSIQVKPVVSFTESKFKPVTFRDVYVILKDIDNIVYLQDLSFNEFVERVYSIGLQHVTEKEAAKYKIHKDPDFISKWRNTRNKLVQRQNEKIINYVLEEIIADDLKITDEEIRRNYEENKEDYQLPSLFKLQKIVVNDVETAEKVKTMLKKGISFSDAAVKYSTEPGVRHTKGITPYLTKTILKSHYYTLENYQINEVLPPIFDEGKYFIYKILDVQQGAMQEYAKVKEQVRMQLIVRKLDAWLESIKKQYNIQVTKYYKEIM